MRKHFMLILKGFSTGKNKSWRLALKLLNIIILNNNYEIEIVSHIHLFLRVF